MNNPNSQMQMKEKKANNSTLDCLFFILSNTKNNGIAIISKYDSLDAKPFVQRLKVALSRIRAQKLKETGNLNRFDLIADILPHETDPNLVDIFFKRKRKLNHLLGEMLEEEKAELELTPQAENK